MAGPDLLPYAITDRQREVISAYQERGSYGKAAADIGCDSKTVWQTVKACQKRAARDGVAPESGLSVQTAPGFALKGYTLGVHPNGEQTVWYKASADAEQQEEIVRQAIDALCQDLPKIKPRKPDGNFSDELMAVIPIADLHMGMRSDPEETEQSYSTSIAAERLCSSVDYLVKQSPRCKRCALIDVGDFFHSNTLEGTTSQARHALDTDGRISLVIKRGMMAFKQCIESALQHHETVEVVIVPGNHNPILGPAFSAAFMAIYANEPRVIVHDESTFRRYIQHGKVLIGVTHGDKTKDADLPSLMAAERPIAWGETKHRYFYRGHLHHDRRVEYIGCIVEMFRTVASNDAYAVENGYLSGQDMKCILLHKEHGEVARTTCALGMLNEAS